MPKLTHYLVVEPFSNIKIFTNACAIFCFSHTNSPASALDAQSEHVVLDALQHLMGGRTTLVIAHRLSTIQKADVIVVMRGGQVVEQGSHDELLRKNGAYAALVQMQMEEAKG